MDTFNNLHDKSENLIHQMRGLKFIMAANRDILSKNPVSNEFLNFKVDIAQNFIEELQAWEELGNQSKCIHIYDSALFFLEQAHALMDRMLREHFNEVWVNSQVKLSFTSYDSPSYEYVVSVNRKNCPICVDG